MTEQIWFKDPAILFTKDTWSKFVPMQDMSTAESLNAVVRFTVYFSMILFVATGVTSYMLSVPIIMVSTILLYNMFPNGKTIETFKAEKKSGQKTTMPSANNPFMNVLLTEIGDNPNRPPAASVARRDVKTEMYKNFQKTTDMYMDTTDLFDQSQAMRTFHTLQSSTVPNDLDGFKKWLAKDQDQPDYSSAPLARGAKLLNEGYVEAKGSMKSLSGSTSKPTGTSPSPPPAKATK